MSKYLVPEEGLKEAIAASDDYLRDNQSRDVHAKVILEAFIAWQSENPPVPTEKQWSEVQFSVASRPIDYQRDFAVEWIRRMYLAPEPEVPEELKDLLWGFDADRREEHQEDVIEAYRRGRAGK